MKLLTGKVYQYSRSLSLYIGFEVDVSLDRYIPYVQVPVGVNAALPIFEGSTGRAGRSTFGSSNQLEMRSYFEFKL